MVGKMWNVEWLGAGDSAANITIANSTIKAVTEFRYLGSISRFLVNAIKIYINKFKWPLSPSARCNAAGVNRV